MRPVLIPCTVVLLVAGVAVLLSSALVTGIAAADADTDERPDDTVVVDYLGAEYALLEVWNDGEATGYRLTSVDELPPDVEEGALLRRADDGREYAYEYDESATEERREAMAERFDSLSERWHDRRSPRLAVR